MIWTIGARLISSKIGRYFILAVVVIISAALIFLKIKADIVADTKRSEEIKQTLDRINAINRKAQSDENIRHMSIDAKRDLLRKWTLG